jgi:preprotein translocase subunit SecA
MMNSIWSDFARMVYNVEVQVEAENGDGALPEQAPSAGVSAIEYSGGAAADQPSPYGGGPFEEGELAYAAEEEDEGGVTPVAQRRLDASEQLGRNDPCWCGSGKKFKKCHGA